MFARMSKVYADTWRGARLSARSVVAGKDFLDDSTVESMEADTLADDDEVLNESGKGDLAWEIDIWAVGDVDEL
jgi:hypothetical protein